MKKCTECKELKTIESFYKSKSNPDGLFYKCKICVGAKNKAYAIKNRDKIKSYNAEWMKRCRKYNPDISRESKLRNSYKMTMLDYKKMVESQNGSCAICLRTPKPGKKLFIDHDHSTGNVRGLLCAVCNMFLGVIKDSSECLNRAKYYLSPQTIKNIYPNKFLVPNTNGTTLT